MCGITCAFEIKENSSVLRPLLLEMSKKLRHRGPDWSGIYSDNNAILSHERLAIVDPVSGKQPLYGQNNDVVLHSDVSVMPKLYKCWSSWVYTERKDKGTDKIDLTYWMNSLQPIPLDDPLFVTLNSTHNIDQNKIYDQVTMRHPVYDVGVLSAQKDLSLNNGHNRTWFSGAWMKNGFHEDGLSSGLDVARSILANDILPIAAE